MIFFAGGLQSGMTHRTGETDESMVLGEGAVRYLPIVEQASARVWPTLGAMLAAKQRAQFGLTSACATLAARERQELSRVAEELEKAIPDFRIPGYG